ncbi:hypothetical protein IGB42_01314 [Andreprevotia sp. IGB-42]|uniref:Spy/CpxP family protein refolding chaperone n=1 Tax=Andreprevotia sp. IGB-42 TaxID=2497473 RepID=UPI00135C34C3|nr:Spy/CpxP family protein refolding chaperone [Andreprevotia sp. IGB-42]KAF0814413.1 hypothetical protein IGB42_01314 [Andreprevotia sp. IGB-42]
MNAINRFGLAALSAALLGGAALTYAAPEKGDVPPPHGEHHRDGRGDHEHRMGPFGLPLRTLDLTDQQKEQVKQIKEALKPQFETKRDAFKQQHQAFEALIETPDADPAKVRAAADAQAKAGAELSVLHAELNQKILAVLTPAQQQQLQQLLKERKDHKRGPRHDRASAPAQK